MLKFIVPQAAFEASKFVPPNTADFDCARDGRVASARPRGRPSVSSTPGASSVSSNLVSLQATLMAAVVPILANTLQASFAASSSSSALLSSSVLAPPSVPPSAPSTPSRPRQTREPPLSPSPSPGMELDACVTDFLTTKGIDVFDATPRLHELDLTPDIINDVPVARLIEVMGLVEGQVRKFQRFCKEWVERLDEKRRHGL